jgi:uncharacterized protein (DUF305 family)
MQMNERMMAAVGVNASETWVRKMIEHHRGGVAMSQILFDQGGEQRFVEMARMTIDKQQREIGELERMLAGGIERGSGQPNPFSPVEQSMHRQMMAAGGGNISETWARKMIAHHQGAVDMSELLIRQGGDPEVLAMARKAAEDQRREIAHLQAMLRGAAMPASDSASAPAAAARKDRQTWAAPATRGRMLFRRPERRNGRRRSIGLLHSRGQILPQRRPAPTSIARWAIANKIMRCCPEGLASVWPVRPGLSVDRHSFNRVADFRQHLRRHLCGSRG